METHIEPLADNTPKNRRRVRRTLGWRITENDAWCLTRLIQPTSSDTGEAQDIARRRERAGAERDAARRTTAKGGTT